MREFAHVHYLSINTYITICTIIAYVLQLITHWLCNSLNPSVGCKINSFDLSRDSVKFDKYETESIWRDRYLTTLFLAFWIRLQTLIRETKVTVKTKIPLPTCMKSICISSIHLSTAFSFSHFDRSILEDNYDNCLALQFDLLLAP